MSDTAMKPRPKAVVLENIANQLALYLPDFSHMDAHDQARCETALRVIASTTQSMRAILGDCCPSCGAFVEEGVTHVG